MNTQMALEAAFHEYREGTFIKNKYLRDPIKVRDGHRGPMHPAFARIISE